MRFLTSHSSDEQKITQAKRESITKRVQYQNETMLGFVQEFCLLVPASRVELVVLVDGGELRLVYDRVLLDEAEPTGVGGGVEGGQDGKLPPAEAVVSPLVLQAPDVPSQAGVDPFARVAEGMGVVPISDLPRGGRYAGVGIQI